MSNSQDKQGELIAEIQSILMAHGYATEWTSVETSVNHNDLILGLRFINLLED